MSDSKVEDDNTMLNITEANVVSKPSVAKWASHLLPTLLEVEAKLGELSIGVADKMTESAAGALKHLSLFHPHDVTQHRVYLTTVCKLILSEKPASLAPQLQAILWNLQQNIKGAINELTTGQIIGGQPFVERSCLFCTNTLRIQVPLPYKWDVDPESNSPKELLTLEQEISWIWGSTLVWFIVKIILFLGTNFVYWCLNTDQSIFLTAQKLITGKITRERLKHRGFLSEQSTDGYGSVFGGMLVITFGFSVVHIGIAFLLNKTELGKNNTWIFKVVHLVLPVFLGIKASEGGDLNRIPAASLGFIPHLIVAVMVAPYYLWMSGSYPVLVSKLLLIGAGVVNYFVIFRLSYIPDELVAIDTDPTEKMIYCIVFSFVISAGWSIMFNHDRRLAGTLESILEADYKIRHKFHGGIIALIFLLPVLVIAMICSAIILPIICLPAACASSHSAKASSRRVETINSYNEIEVVYYNKDFDPKEEREASKCFELGSGGPVRILRKLTLAIAIPETRRVYQETN